MKKIILLGLTCLLGFALSARADTTVVFNEVMYHPATNASAMEWVELYNQMAVDVDMSKWLLDGDIHYRFAADTILHGGAFMVVAISPADLAAATGLTNILGPFTGQLSSTNGQLLLRDNNNRIVSEVDYGTSGAWPVAPNGAGVSLAKLDHSTTGDQPGYWAPSAQMGGTPGQENFPTPPIVVPLAFNELSATTNSDFWLELMNYGTNTLSLGGYVIARAGATNSQYALASGTTLPPGGFLVLSNTALGFHPATGDQLYLLPPTPTNVLDAVMLQGGARGRSPDGTGQWLNPTTLTPGAANQFVFHREIVINEIMYHHQLLRDTNGLPPQASAETWIELYNRSNSVVDLTGWTIGGGISYSFAAGQTINPGAYLVVAKDKAALRVSYPAIQIVGNLSGKLSHHGDTIILQDPAGNPANTVSYNTDGRWAHAAAGGGSSLELRDPNADNSTPGAWAASDETAKSSWQTYTYQAVAQTVIGVAQWNDLVISLLTDGECLIDDISVIESPTNNPVEFITNGSFEDGAAGWRFLGTHIQSRVEVDPDNPANHLLHLISTGPAEHHMLNHIETTFANGNSVTDGNLYQVSFRAKWLSGIPLLNTKLYFNRVAQTTVLPTPVFTGTPGARNSCYATNIGPTFTQFQHQPVVPPPDQPVAVSVVAQDPQGVSLCEVWWSVNGGSFSQAAMTAQSNGLYTGTIPGYAAGTIVQFYVQAVDGLGAVSTYPAAGPNSGALYLVADGQADLNLGHNLRIVLTPANWELMIAPTNIMSGALLPCTLIYDEQRPYYDIGVRLQGSMIGRVNSFHHGYHVEFQPDDLFRGVHPVMEVKTSGRRDGINQQEAILTHHMILHAGGLPDVQNDIGTVIPPFYTNTCQALLYPRFYDEFISTAYPNGGDGNDWLYELIYYPTLTNQYGYKYPTPDSVGLWGTDITDLGTNKETYRYNFILKNNHTADDFSRLIPFCQTLNLPNTPVLDAQSKQVMDLDEWLRLFTIVSLTGEGDWPTFGYPHNPQIYQRPDNNKMELFPWDVEQLFLAPGGAAAPLIGGNGAQNWTDLENATNSTGLGFPGNTRRMYAHALDIFATTFNTSHMSYWTAHYASFCPGQDFSDMLAWIEQRTAAVMSEINDAGGNSPFAVTGPNFITTASNLVTLTGTAPVQVQSLLINGVAYPITWTSVAEWTVTVPVGSPTNVLQVTAYDLNGNLLTNYTGAVTVNYTGSAPNPVGSVVINEIMYNPLLPGASYVELLNTSATETFDLSNWQVNGLGYTFPPGSILGSGQFLVLAKDQSAFITAYGPAIVPFDVFAANLSANGETLTLQMPGSQTNQTIVVDKVRYSASAPWPGSAPGAALQLIDPAQDNSRVANWASTQANIAGAPQWAYFSATGTASSSLLYIYLEAAGDVYIDDLKLVAGSVPDVGSNVLADGDFESGFPGPWAVSPNLSSSGLSTQIKHSGAASLHLVASSGGSSQSSSIYQTTSPALASGQPYALSFWFLQSTNPAVPILTVRLSGSGIVANVNPGSSSGTTLAPATPGTNNSVQTILPPFPPLWINELQADNLTGITNSAGQHSPWLELYNPGTNAVALSSLYLANSYTNLTAWAFPTGAVLNPGEFKVIFADGETGLATTNELHTSFTLPSRAGSLALSWVYNGQAQVLDYVDYTNLTPDHSYGSFPDGQSFDRREFFYPTPGGTNNGSTGGSFIGYAVPGSVYTQDFDSLPNPGLASVNTANPVTISGISYSLPDPFDFAVPPVASGSSGGLGLPLLAGWYGLAQVSTKFGATDGDQTTGGQISFGEPNSPNRSLGLLATSSTGFTAFGARFINQTANTLNQINLQITGEIWRQSNKGKTLQFYYLVDPTATNTFSTNATAFLPALNVSFPTVPADVGGVAVDGALPANQTNLSVFSQVISNWPPGAALWLVWEMADPASLSQGLGIDSFSFSASMTISNQPPVLAPISNACIYAGQTLHFTASATDPDQPPQAIAFTLDPSAPAGASISPTGVFTWPAMDVPVPSTNNITIRVTDNGSPPLSAAEAFSVAVLPLPQIHATRPMGAVLPLSFSTLSGQTYQVQFKDDLDATAWDSLGAPVPGTGAVLEVDDDTTGHAQRFYRLMVLP